MEVEEFIYAVRKSLGPHGLHDEDLQFLRQANVQSFDQLAELTTWFPGVAKQNVQIANLSALAMAHASSATIAAVAQAAAHPPLHTFGALPT
jgi:hypothetical protein